MLLKRHETAQKEGCRKKQMTEMNQSADPDACAIGENVFLRQMQGFHKVYDQYEIPLRPYPSRHNDSPNDSRQGVWYPLIQTWLDRQTHVLEGAVNWSCPTIAVEIGTTMFSDAKCVKPMGRWKRVKSNVQEGVKRRRV